MTGGDLTLIGHMVRAMICAATLGGEIYVATEHPGEVVGYAVWMPPGQELLSTFVVVHSIEAAGPSMLVELIGEQARATRTRME